jgi:hypothetical protein
MKVKQEIIPIISNFFWGYGGYNALLQLFTVPTVEESHDSQEFKIMPLETLD